MKSILVVDDSASIRMALAHMLSIAKYGAEQARGGPEALALLRTGPKVDLIITDLNMPEMNGIELIREVRKLPAYRFTPCLVVTTETQQARRIEAKAAGATGWLVKPVAAPDLLAVLEKLLGGP